MKKVTAIKGEGGRKKRLSLYLDGRLTLKLEPEVVLKENLIVGKELTDAEISFLEKLNCYQRTLNAATHFLAYRPRSQSELRERLKRRRFAEGDIKAVIVRLKEQGLVDDAAFAQFWKENRESFSPRSRYLTTLELKRKGVPREVAEEVVSTLDDSENAYRAGLLKARRLSLSEQETFRRRLGEYLRRRGFTYEVISETVERLWQELKERNY